MKKIISLVISFAMTLTLIAVDKSTQTMAQVIQVFDGTSLTGVHYYENIKLFTNTSGDWGMEEEEDYVYIKADDSVNPAIMDFEVPEGANSASVRFTCASNLVTSFHFYFSANGTDWTEYTDQGNTQIVAATESTRSVYLNANTIPEGSEYFRVEIDPGTWYNYRISEITFSYESYSEIYDGTTLDNLESYDNVRLFPNSDPAWFQEPEEEHVYMKNATADAHVVLDTGEGDRLSVRLTASSGAIRDSYGFFFSIDGSTWVEYNSTLDWEVIYLTGVGDRSVYETDIRIPQGMNYFKLFFGGTYAWHEYRVSQIHIYDSGEQLPETEMVLSKDVDDFKINIYNWDPDHQYQIWTYQEITSGIFAEEEEVQNQWILSQGYASPTDPEFSQDPDGSISSVIGSFASVDNNYTVAVKVVDGEGNFVGQYKDTFTPEGVGEAVISKVTVDGQFADEKTQVKQIDTGAIVSFMVHGNEVEGMQYSATVDTTGEVLTPMGEGNNGFEWDISGLEPGSYSVTLRAFTDTSTDTRKINFKLYKIDETITYGRMDSLSVTGTVDSGNYKVDIDPTIASGDNFRYRLSEPWRGAFHDSGLMTTPSGTESYTGIPETSYGIFQIATYTYRTGVASADDGDIKTVNNARGGTDLTVTVDTVEESGVISKAKGSTIALAAAAEGIPNPEYSFWRRDANGWVLIKDYSIAGEVTWVPNRVGLYTIQVRARNADGLSYEEAVNLEFDITDATDTKANVTNITINQATLDSDAAARTPITITANATADSEDLLYKYIISNGFIYYVETSYSPDPTYIWVPGKSGDYTISVLVKNKVSFGKYDAIQSFTVNVN